MLLRLYQASRKPRTAALLALLLSAAGAALAQVTTLRERLIDIEEVTRISPQRALRQLDQIKPEVDRASPAEQAAFLSASSDAQHRSGRYEEALALSERAIQIGVRLKDSDVIARASLAKAYALFRLGKVTEAHRLVWEAEKLGSETREARLRVLLLIASGDSHIEEGNFATALEKLQLAATIARNSGDPLLTVISLRSLALLYDRTREYDKGFALLDEATLAAKKANSLGRLALLKSTEYALAMDSNQIPRALKAMLTALELQRKLDAGPLIGISLVNLADCYLKLQDYPNALSYARQALQQANRFNDERLAATARLNIGQAYLQMGRRLEGKKYMQLGMDQYEKAGNKSELQMVMGEYADALANAGDFSAAVTAYKRERTLLSELFEERRQKAMSELQERYEADSKQRQIEMLRQENEVKSVEIDNRRLQQRVWWLLAVVSALVSIIVAALYRKVRHANAQLETKNLELKQQSAQDPLTALYNRRHFQEFMRGHQEIVQRDASAGEDMTSAIFLLDVDHFKTINDNYGHAAGDAVLKEIARSMREILRETDMIVRWGGEEFLAFLPSVPRGSLENVARRLLTGIPASRIDYQGTTLSVQVSIGFAPFPLVAGTSAVSWERAVNLVDMALYLAKGHGRNRAYGIHGLADVDDAALAEIELDIEAAWKAGKVNLSIVRGTPVDMPAVA